MFERDFAQSIATESTRKLSFEHQDIAVKSDYDGPRLEENEPIKP